MSRHDAIASRDPTPTPTPVSEERLATANDTRAASRRRFNEAFGDVIDKMDLTTWDEIHHRYGGDPERELVDIKEGRHPLQRDGRGIDAYSKYEAKLAAIRAKLGR